MTRSKGLALLAVLSAWPVLNVHSQQAPGARGPLEGAWNYQLPRRGQSVFVGHHYVMFNARPDSAPTGATLSESDQAMLYRTLSLQSGTFTISDTIVTMTPAYGKNPNAKPATWRWSYAIRGDTMTWRVLNSAGAVTQTGRSIRIP